VLDHWAASLAFVGLLRLTQALVDAPLLPPFYFVAIPPAFYLLLWLCNVSVQEAREGDWFFPPSEEVDPFLIWELIDFRLVNWGVVAACLPTIIALTVFSLMHVPIVSHLSYHISSIIYHPSLLTTHYALHTTHTHTYTHTHTHTIEHPLSEHEHPPRRGHES
jgi:hypothetical protein